MCRYVKPDQAVISYLTPLTAYGQVCLTVILLGQGSPMHCSLCDADCHVTSYSNAGCLCSRPSSSFAKSFPNRLFWLARTSARMCSGCNSGRELTSRQAIVLRSLACCVEYCTARKLCLCECRACRTLQAFTVHGTHSTRAGQCLGKTM